MVTWPAVSLAQDRESLPARTGSLTTMLRHQLIAEYDGVAAAALVVADLSDYWWVLVILAILLLILIIVICCCVCCNRCKGDTYHGNSLYRSTPNIIQKCLLAYSI